jgi:hypothetical protein
LKSTAKALFVLAGGLLLGILYAALGAFTFSLNNVMMRRGVVTGSVLQGMALTVPIGAVSFVVMTAAFGALDQIAVFPMAALVWLAAKESCISSWGATVITNPVSSWV